MRAKAYHCETCGWKGTTRPEIEEAAPCPHCGSYMYPQPWTKTWGLAALMVLAVLALAGLVAFIAMR